MNSGLFCNTKKCLGGGTIASNANATFKGINLIAYSTDIFIKGSFLRLNVCIILEVANLVGTPF